MSANSNAGRQGAFHAQQGKPFNPPKNASFEERVDYTKQFKENKK